MGKAALIIENCGKAPLLLRTVLVCMESYEERYGDRMLTLELLQKMLLNAAVALKDNVLPLCELDSVAGDGDHGLPSCRQWRRPLQWPKGKRIDGSARLLHLP